jgi:hypothetical protein
MTAFEEIKDYLPRYLSDTAQESLFQELKGFPDNLDSRLYTTALNDEPRVFQGDGIRDLLVLELPDRDVRPAPCMVVSNTCDISLQNSRLFPIRATYAPIISFSKLEARLCKSSTHSPDSIENFLFAVRRQHVTNMFYLPRGYGLEYEGIVLMDRLSNCPSEDLVADITNRRIFTLSHYGHYLLLLKMSIHFTRIREGVARSHVL